MRVVKGGESEHVPVGEICPDRVAICSSRVTSIGPGGASKVIAGNGKDQPWPIGARHFTSFHLFSRSPLTGTSVRLGWGRDRVPDSTRGGHVRLDCPNPASWRVEQGDMGHMVGGIGHLQQARVFHFSESENCLSAAGNCPFHISACMLARSPLDRVNVRS